MHIHLADMADGTSADNTGVEVNRTVVTASPSITHIRITAFSSLNVGLCFRS